MRLVSLSIAALLFSVSTAAAEFTISFEWGDIPNCRSGNSNVVGSPAFVLSGVPAGTTSIEFLLKDRNNPRFDHGGGRVKVGSDGQLPFGAFKYLSPCPPRGSNTYVWTATARANKKVLARATASRKYPE